MEEHCKTCGSIFESIHGRKYCCEECRKEAKREKGRRFYSKHKEEYNAKSCNRIRIRREKLIEAGLCTCCGKSKPRKGKKTCFACAVKRSQKYYEKMEKNRAGKEMEGMIQHEQCAEQKTMEDHK